MMTRSNNPRYWLRLAQSCWSNSLRPRNLQSRDAQTRDGTWRRTKGWSRNKFRMIVLAGRVKYRRRVRRIDSVFHKRWEGFKRKEEKGKMKEWERLWGCRVKKTFSTLTGGTSHWRPLLNLSLISLLTLSFWWFLLSLLSSQVDALRFDLKDFSHIWDSYDHLPFNAKEWTRIGWHDVTWRAHKRI